MVEHVVHVAFEARTDIVGVHAGDTVSRDVVSPMTPADMLLQRLQPAVGQLLSPTAAGVMEELRALGIRLALDDFGSGYASIGYLRQLKFERLKIDKQFLRDAGRDLAGAELLVAIVALGRALRLEITAEGVETEEQAALVRACGCHRAQGWLFGRPVAEAGLLQTVASLRGMAAPIAATG